jgi:hypothetical protein
MELCQRTLHKSPEGNGKLDTQILRHYGVPHPGPMVAMESVRPNETRNGFEPFETDLGRAGRHPLAGPTPPSCLPPMPISDGMRGSESRRFAALPIWLDYLRVYRVASQTTILDMIDRTSINAYLHTFHRSRSDVFMRHLLCKDRPIRTAAIRNPRWGRLAGK